MNESCFWPISRETSVSGKETNGQYLVSPAFGLIDGYYPTNAMLVLLPTGANFGAICGF